ncbi:MAG: serine/threonine-protein kinase [Actinomycetota bacterium]
MGEVTVAGRSPLATVMPEYEFLGELGRGAMGVVVSARHRKLGRLVAVKELPPAFAADEAVRARFLREGRTLAELDHPHVVVVHDLIDRDGHLALVMEQLAGGTVWERFTTVGLTASVACGLMLSAASGLDHAHRHQILHRDIKPENLMFTTSGQLKVTDFGMAKVMGGERTLATADGVVLGTPAYMSPEQAEGAAIGPEADVYACGTMLHELLCGRLPFAEANSAVAMLVARVRDEAPPIRERAPSVPEPVADVVDTALARRIDHRFPSIEDFAVCLGHAAADSWGPEWLADTGVTVTGSETIERASRTSLHPAGPTPVDPWAQGRDVRAPDTIVDLRVDGSGATEAVRGSGNGRHSMLDLRRVSPAQMVDVALVEVAAPVPIVAPISSMAQRPVEPGPRPAWLWLAALFFGVAALSILGGSFLAGGSRVVASPLQINGQPVVSEPVEVALDQPVEVSGLGAGEAAQLDLAILGVPVGRAQSQLAGGRAVFDASYFQLTTAGVVTAELTVDSEPLPRAKVAMAPTHRWWLTAEAAVLALVVAFGLASFSSHLKGFRRSSSLVGPVAGIGFATAVLTLALSAGVVLAAQHVPTVGAVILGSTSSVLAAVLLGAGARGRVRRRVYLTTWT